MLEPVRKTLSVAGSTHLGRIRPLWVTSTLRINGKNAEKALYSALNASSFETYVLCTEFQGTPTKCNSISQFNLSLKGMVVGGI